MSATSKQSQKKEEKRPKSDVVAHKSNEEISGFGENVVKVVDVNTGANICFIAIVDNEEKVFFNKITNLAEIEAVADLLHKKKFNKLLNHGKIEKAQSYADKKFHLD
jgi:hypothetical protein